MDDSAPTPGSSPLNGWKDIATYVGRSVRSVQRYERELGLPIHRLKTANGQTVYAFAHEIDAWRRSLDIALTDDEDTPGPMRIASVEERPAARSALTIRPSWITLGLVGLAALIVVTTELALHRTLTQKTLQAVHFTLVGRSLEARDARDQISWRYTFDRAVTGLGSGGEVDPEARLVDFDGSGSPDVVIAIRFSERDRPSGETDAVFAFRPDGRLRWVVRPTREFRCGGDRFDAPWFIQALTVSAGPGPQHLWVAYHHASLWPNFVLEIGPDGTDHLRFVHTGWIFALAQWTTPSGSMLAAAGVSNKFNRPTLSLIPNIDLPIMAPSTDAEDQCDGVQSRQLIEEVVFPNSEITPLAGNPYDVPAGLQVLGNTLKVTVGRGDPQIYELGDDLAVKDFFFGDAFWAAHHTYEAQGMLKHPAENCPERTATRQLQVWRPDGGWRDTSAKPR
jgi:hypothetical protein